MKICHIANPASVHTQRWINYFADKDHEMHLIYFDPIYQPQKPAPVKGVHFHRISFLAHEVRTLSYPYEIMQMQRIINFK